MDVQLNVNFIWVFIGTMLVILMQVGFALLEIGLTRGKNSINVAMKNISDFIIGSLLFACIGFPLMYGISHNGFVGTDLFFFSGMEGNDWNWSFLLFQIAFAGTAATIVSGAIAERVKFSGYLIGTALITVFVYPIFGHWAWGSLLNGETSGWLEELGFMDFAGSTVVHSVGAWLSLAALILIGPRIGKYGKDGTVRHIKPSNPILAATGMFFLWIGWFGFNAGSTTSGDSSIAIIALNTQLAAASGGALALFYSWLTTKTPKIDAVINGVLGGLVAVTAGCNVFDPTDAILVGLLGGLITTLSFELLDKKLKIDDAVGAVAVHGFAGAFGTLAIPLFASADTLVAGSRMDQFLIQLLGVGICFIWAFGLGLLIFYVLKKCSLLRVSTHEEETGLDLVEHGESFYVASLSEEITPPVPTQSKI